MADCFADVVTSFRPELSGSAKALTTLDRGDFIEQIRKERASKGPLLVMEVTADRGLVSLVLQFEDGSLGSNIMQFTKDDLIERTFMRRGVFQSLRAQI